MTRRKENIIFAKTIRKYISKQKVHVSVFETTFTKSKNCMKKAWICTFQNGYLNKK